MRAIGAGLVYVALVYMAGFALGAVRQMLIAPRTGSLAAVLIEAPVMVAATMLAARWVARRLHVARDVPSRLAMGISGFVVLMVVEAFMARVLRGLSPEAWLADFGKAEGGIALALFLLFAAMPMLVRDSDRGVS